MRLLAGASVYTMSIASVFAWHYGFAFVMVNNENIRLGYKNTKLQFNCIQNVGNS